MKLVRKTNARRTGSIIPLVVVCIIALFGCVALGIDLGMVAVARRQAQDAPDPSTLAGPQRLAGLRSGHAKSLAEPIAQNAAARNTVLMVPISASQVTVITGVYRYNSTAQLFEPDFSGAKADSEAWTAMQVTVNTTSPTYF